jgi:hypothetical protein
VQIAADPGGDERGFAGPGGDMFDPFAAIGGEDGGFAGRRYGFESAIVAAGDVAAGRVGAQA